MRTWSRVARAAALGVVVTFIALHDAVAADRVILVLGDSLSAAYGLQPEQGWVALLAQRLQSQGYGYQLVNASVSGETSEGGLTRLPRALGLHGPALVILELGANDGLRGLPVAATRDNLGRIVQLARAAGARVLLIGIRIPPNYGPRYTQEFAAVFPALAKQYDLPLVPFLLEGVALDATLMQEDGLHPNSRGEPRVLETVWPYLQPLLKKNTATGGR
ncbi:MAG: arylesterase [Steroidobacteraceae bacterium]